MVLKCTFCMQVEQLLALQGGPYDYTRNAFEKKKIV